MIPVAIALGSNVGNRAEHLDWAVSRLRGFVDGLMVSSYIETAPVGVGGADFLNAAVAGHTALAPRALLDALLALEAERGRVRTGSTEPRTLDLDLILYGNLVIDEPGLAVPHPRVHERAFVLAPLAEIVPGWIDPRSGQTIAELSAAPK
ncbi:MAG TPA: 2-amino-4-hydroxy-6-hydroxymethyldihydropteridine diphosphokinase [Vicinamibacterales bacterium]|nr:2-amino-4-hydroxy-6-hydroxymethyldihydropteridine diphosphokinase [Vicinamibacterales bacterium]